MPKRLLWLLICGWLACSKEEPQPTCGPCEAPNVCVRGECASPGTPLVQAPIGREPGQLGVNIPEEAADVAPMSLAAAGGERVWILDQENQRLQLFNGDTFERALPLDSATYQDLVLLDGDRVALMDRHGSGQIVVQTLDGRVEQRVGLRGTGIDEAGLAGNMEKRPDGVWVAYARYMVRVLDARGAADPIRPIVYGHLSWDGNDVTSFEFKGDQLYVLKRNRTGPMQKVEVRHGFDRPISYVSEIHSDRAGNLYLLVNFFGKEAPPERQLVVLGLALERLRTLDITREPDSQGGEVFRELDVSADGEVFMLGVAGSDVKVRRY